MPPSLGAVSPCKPPPAARSRPSPEGADRAGADGAGGKRTRVTLGAEAEAANARMGMGVPTAVEAGLRVRRQRAAAEQVAAKAAAEATAEAAAQSRDTAATAAATAAAAAAATAPASAAAAAQAAAMPRGTLVVHGVRTAASPHAATREGGASEEGLDGRSVSLRFLLLLPGGELVAAGETSALAGATHVEWRGEQLPLPLPLPSRAPPPSSAASAALSLRVELREEERGGGEGGSDGADGRLLAAAEVPLDGARLGGGQAELLLAPLDPALACSVRVSFSHTLLPPGYRAKPTRRAASTEPAGMSVQIVSVSIT